jgi:hypothetical protein
VAELIKLFKVVVVVVVAFLCTIYGPSFGSLTSVGFQQMYELILVYYVYLLNVLMLQQTFRKTSGWLYW